MRTLAILPPLAVAVLSSACSSESDGGGSSDGNAAGSSDTGWSVTPPTSGTRLRAKVITGGGARELVAFYDTARGEDCTFQAVKDGRMFCLPRSVLGALSGAFADASCKQPLMVVPSCAAGVKYAMTIGSSACGQSEVQALQPIGGQASAAYTSNGASCVAQASTPGSVALGAPIPWTDFVEARVSAEERDGLVENVAIASDGARQHLGYRNAKLSADCTFQRMADGVTRCVPGTTTGQIIYSGCRVYAASGRVRERPEKRELPRDPASGRRDSWVCVYARDLQRRCPRERFGAGDGIRRNGLFIRRVVHGRLSHIVQRELGDEHHLVASSAGRLTGGGGGRLVPASCRATEATRSCPPGTTTSATSTARSARRAMGRSLPPERNEHVRLLHGHRVQVARAIAPAMGARSCGETGSRFARVTESVCGATANQNPPTNPSPVIGTPAIELETDVLR